MCNDPFSRLDLSPLVLGNVENLVISKEDFLLTVSNRGILGTDVGSPWWVQEVVSAWVSPQGCSFSSCKERILFPSVTALWLLSWGWMDSNLDLSWVQCQFIQTFKS